MDTTVCPWCQTEIVWDEEIGPEENCPYCMNELKGYRTLNIQIGDEEENNEEQPDWVEDGEEGDDTSFWAQEDMQHHLPPSIRTLDKFEESHDLMNYEENVEKILDEQEEVPECPKCRDYMILAGTQEITDQGFVPTQFSALKAPVIKPPFRLNMYICTGCFHVESNLTEEDRLRMVDHLSREKA
ncbi:hypothetical protein MUG84_16520 [Paenibacillus sp. KQZ6P-2]|uniref:Uncharacterized protein n=1 Tax=Paenibacillus mangrovi TaxID=2931978 RepID=A0A9X2B3V3_9BACL|nr:hypothetical protein [Paenibacillus mangrovi]MCJ8013335.1 hypothetical protein [Paenibacillus mangrovi]